MSYGAMYGSCTRYGTDSSTSHVAKRRLACMPPVEYRAPSCQCRVTVHDAIACYLRIHSTLCGSSLSM
jgi:hypothetical protein